MRPPKPPPGLVERPEDFFRRTHREARFFLLKFIRRGQFVQFCICLVIIGIYLFALSTPYLERLEYIFLDSFFQLRPPIAIHPAIAYIEIADDSLQALGPWPWPRRYHAVLTHLLTEWKAKAIVFDVLFGQPSVAFDDGALKEAFEEAKSLYLPVVLKEKKNGKIWIHSLPEFEAPAQGNGHINIEPDRDGTLRRIQPFLSYGGESHPYLAFRVAYDYLGSPEKLSFFKETDQGFLINWTGKWKDTFEHYSYVDLIKSFELLQKGRPPIVSPEKIKGKICLIGLTALGHSDVKASPIEAAYPGVGVHANVINSILTQRFVHAASSKVNGFCLAGIGLLASLLFVVFRNVRAFIGGLLVGFLWILISFLFFCQKGIWLYVMHPLLLVVSLYIFSTVFVLILKNRERIRLFQLATRDGLTGLFVIRYFRTLLNEAAQEARKRKKPLSVILGDIDHFKRVNDTYGHGCGDMVLKEIARVIKSAVLEKESSGKELEKNVVARYGGEEMIIMLFDCGLRDAAFNVAERIRRQVEQETFTWEGKSVSVTISFGVATLHPEETVPDLMVLRADKALYRAKEGGRNRVSIENSEKK